MKEFNTVKSECSTHLDFKNVTLTFNIQNKEKEKLRILPTSVTKFKRIFHLTFMNTV